MSDVPRERLCFLDALRGVAAMAVMVYHYSTGKGFRLPLVEALPVPVVGLLGHGWLGVQTFFVLSGFVIAHAIGDHVVTWKGALRFALRRQVRLDPPYWTSITLSLALTTYYRLRFGPTHALPTPQALVAHVLYVQEILHLQAIQPAYWTLAIEVQFYLLFITVAALVDPKDRPRAATPWVVAALGMWSFDLGMHWRFLFGWLIPHGYLFALGACCRYALGGRLPKGFFLAGLLACALFGQDFKRIEPCLGASVAGVIYLVGRRGALATALRGRGWQWLGKLSYGIYLVHTITGAAARGILGPWARDGSAIGALRSAMLAIPMTLAVAWLLHEHVERPAMRWASRVKWTEDPTPEAKPALPSA